jgi:hypothetical protein
MSRSTSSLLLETLNVTVAGADVPQDFGGACDQGGANPFSLPGRCHADASEGSGGGAESTGALMALSADLSDRVALL